MTPQDTVEIPNDPQSIPALHWTFLLMALGIILLSFTMTAQGGDKVTLPGFAAPLPELCATKAYTGVRCPGCGLSRSFIAISHGQFAKAWRLNPASVLVYLFVLVQIPWQAFQLSRIYRGKTILESLWLFVPLVACAIALFTQWVLKLTMGI